MTVAIRVTAEGEVVRLDLGHNLTLTFEREDGVSLVREGMTLRRVVQAAERFRAELVNLGVVEDQSC